MLMTLAIALLASGILLLWSIRIGTHLASPPRWTSDDIVMCVIAPLAIVLGAAGGGLFAYLIAEAAWRTMTVTEFAGVGAVLAVVIALGFALARWSRRAPGRRHR
ncbi:MAG: hypothetical protein R3357_13915, partial [Burkholderiales bacterium]|nr:hypothetical protein [Burkholderiales bacterium]